MPTPFLLLQLSDSHIGSTWGDGDSFDQTAATVEHIRRLPNRPDAVVVTGDLADNGEAAEYAALGGLVDRLGVPCYPLPGNHDDRAVLRSHFGLPGEDGAPINYSVEIGPLRLVILDSTTPGEDGGDLGEARLSWLDRELSVAPEQPTIVAMHHPPLLTGAPAWDRIGLPDRERQALGAVLERHSHVRLVIGGHMHRTIASRLAGRPVLAAPAIYRTALPDFETDELKLGGSAPAYVLHAVVDGEITSHVLRAE
jgi:3',5'-cyclic AMP phosphodiesterase CpdA